MKNNKLVRLTILGVEQTFKNKFWIILNVLMILASLVFVNFSTVKEIINSRKSEEAPIDNEDVLNVMIQDETNMFLKMLEEKNNENIIVKDYTENGIEEGNTLIEIVLDDKEYIKAKISSSEYIDIEYYNIFEEIINEIRDEVFAKQNNIDKAEISIISTPIKIERVITTLDVTTYEKYSGIFFAVTFVIYMLFIFISSSLASTIGVEKVSKTTEYMLTGISENAYLWYNILQTNIVVILQSALAVIYFVVASLIKAMLSVSFLGMNIALGVGGNLAFSIEPVAIWCIVIALIQSILGILILSIIQAVFSAKVNNMSDVSNSTVVVLFFVIFATMIFPNIIPTTENVNIFLKIVSLVPVVSVVAVPKLLLLGQINLLVGILSIVVTIISLIICTIFGSKAFKKGLLSTSKSNKKEERVESVKIKDFNEAKFKSSMSKVSMALILFLICSNLLGVIGQIITANMNPTLKYIIDIVIWIVSIYPSYWYLKNSNYTKIQTKKEKINTKNIAFISFVGFGLVWAVQLLMEKVGLPEIDMSSLISLDFSNALNCILAAIYMAVLPAIFEELLFRKAIFGALKKYGVKIAIIVSSVAFGLVHQNVTQGVFAMIIGIIFCLMNLKAKSILPSMIVHFMNNSLAVIQMIILESYGESKLDSIMSIIGIILMVWIIASIIIVIISKIKKVRIIEKSDDILEIKNPLKVIFTDFVTIMAMFVYVVITVSITKIM